MLTTVREAKSREHIIFHNSVQDNYHLRKGWAFWLQVVVLCFDIILIALCLIENQKLKLLDELGFTAFIANPNQDSLSRFSTSEFFNPNFQRGYLSSDKGPISTISDPSNDGWVEFPAQNCHLLNRAEDNRLVPSISYNNPAFLNESPDLTNNRKMETSFNFI